jgi:hypothetical protein
MERPMGQGKRLHLKNIRRKFMPESSFDSVRSKLALSSSRNSDFRENTTRKSSISTNGKKSIGLTLRRGQEIVEIDESILGNLQPKNRYSRQ